MSSDAEAEESQRYYVHRACVDYNKDSMRFYLPFRDTSNPLAQTKFSVFNQDFKLEFNPERFSEFNMDDSPDQFGTFSKSSVPGPRCDFTYKNNLRIQTTFMTFGILFEEDLKIQGQVVRNQLTGRFKPGLVDLNGVVLENSTPFTLHLDLYEYLPLIQTLVVASSLEKFLYVYSTSILGF